MQPVPCCKIASDVALPAHLRHPDDQPYHHHTFALTHCACTDPSHGFAGAQAATVYETAKAAGLTTLVAVIDAADFKGTFDNPHLRATVFAPTNEAFDALIKALGVPVEEVLANKALLRKVLKYHLVDGKPVKAAQVPTKLTKVYTWLGKPLGLKRAGAAVTISYGKGLTSKASVATADVKAARSIVHVVDTVRHFYFYLPFSLALVPLLHALPPGSSVTLVCFDLQVLVPPM